MLIIEKKVNLRQYSSKLRNLTIVQLRNNHFDKNNPENYI